MRSPRVLSTALLAACVGAGCGSEPDEELGIQEPSEPPRAAAPKSCDMPTGFYEVTLERRNGNCGPQAGFIADLSRANFATGTVGSCTGQGSARDRNCTYQTTATCPGTLTAQQMLTCEIVGNCATPVVTNRVHVEWDPSLDFATGLWSIMIDGRGVGVSCSGTYDVTYTRL